MYKLGKIGNVLTVVMHENDTQLSLVCDWLDKNGYKCRYFIKDATKFTSQHPGLYIGDTLVTQDYNVDRLLILRGECDR